ncbi:DUF2975 domain-containing protein [Erythrobacter sp.]|uniref:DUF2975 domain-containing protein n=1 Tax=Erythrobacter sp. TaxID=1042 RepID=UPI002E9EC570|nr:DUF2975 domain-containing protein [Erythrobacter sp.]
MNEKPNDLLLLAGKVLTVLMQIFMAIAAIALAIAIPIILIFSGTINAEIAAEYGDAVGSLPLAAMIALFASLLVLVLLVFVFFGKLRAIIASVGEGDPFVPENAQRLNMMAWLMLAVQAIMISIAGFAVTVATWASDFEEGDFAIEVGLDLTGVLIVIVLFILARVFKHGAAMREDLEGTV